MGRKAGLDLQDGLREPHVRGGHDRQRPVVRFVDRVGDVGSGDVDAGAPLDLHGFLDPADLHGDVVTDRLAALEQNPARHGFLESLHVHGDRILAEDQRRTRVRAGGVRNEDRVDPGRLVVDCDGRAGQRGTLRVGDDTADDGAIGALCEQGRAQADAQAEGGN